MGEAIRIGGEPPAAPPPRSGKLIGVVAGLIVLVSAGAWLAGAFRGAEPAPTTITLPPETTTTASMDTTTTTGIPADRIQRAHIFWTAMGAGDAIAATAAVAEPQPGAAELVAFVAALAPRLEVEDCGLFAANAVSCRVTVSNEDLLAIGLGNPRESLLVSDDGWFDVPSVVASAAARLSLYALNVHTEEVRAACPLTDSPPVQSLTIVGSPTGDCGAYLAGLIPEYLGAHDTTTTVP